MNYYSQPDNINCPKVERNTKISHYFIYDILLTLFGRKLLDCQEKLVKRQKMKLYALTTEALQKTEGTKIIHEILKLEQLGSA